MPMQVEAVGIRKAYGGREVLHGIDLKARKGEILAVIGPNGAGKSTLLRILNLIERPSSGSVFLDGADCGSLDGAAMLGLRRRVGSLLQNPVLFSGSVRHNVGYGLKLRGIESERKVSAALRRVGLAGFGGRKVSCLSGGERQRVALARALAFGPELLLLDEPAANIDRENAALVEKAIAEAGRKTAVVLSTHDLFQARRIADMAAFMDGGRIVECERTAKLFGSPENERTRRFVAGEAVP